MKSISKPSLLGRAFPSPNVEVPKQLLAELATAREIAASKRVEAAALRQSSGRAFESARFAASKGGAT